MATNEVFPRSITSDGGSVALTDDVLGAVCADGSSPSSSICGTTVVITGHAFLQNIRRGHYELGVEEIVNLRVLTAFNELALAI